LELENLRLTVELHCHTNASRDGLMPPERLLEVCRRKGIDRVAVTDHNTIAGALAAQRLDPERVIVGEEILTTQGELLAYFVREEIPARLTPEETIRRLRDQGAVISVSHPFDHTRKGSWRDEDLQAILPHVDALEIFNARALSMGPNRKAEAVGRRAGLPGAAGSDAHIAYEVGRAVMRLPAFEGAEGMRRALAEGEIEARLSPFWVHFFSSYASWRKRRMRGL
jgi:predicted metal-dependent phosphoesterase TrpH